MDELKIYTEERDKIIAKLELEIIQKLANKCGIQDIQDLEGLKNVFINKFKAPEEDLTKQNDLLKTKTQSFGEPIVHEPSTSKTNETFSTENERLHQEIVDLQTEKETLQKEIVDLQIKSQNFETEKVNLVQRIQEIENESKQNKLYLEKENDQLKGENKQLTEQYNKIVNENKDHTDNINLTEANALLLQQNEDLNNEKKNLLKKIKSLNVAITNKNNQIEIKRKSNHKLDEAIKRKKQELSTDTVNVKKRLISSPKKGKIKSKITLGNKDYMKILEKDNDDLGKDNVHLKEQLKLLVESNEKYKKEIESLKKYEGESINENFRLQKELDDCKKQMEITKDKYDKEIEYLKSLKSEYTPNEGKRMKLFHKNLDLKHSEKVKSLIPVFTQMPSVQNPVMDLEEDTPNTSNFVLPDDNLNDFDANFSADNIVLQLTDPIYSGTEVYGTEIYETGSYETPMLHYSNNSNYEGAFNTDAIKLNATNFKLLFISFFEYHFRKIANPEQKNLKEDDIKLLNDLKQLLDNLKAADKNNYTDILYFYIHKQICSLTNFEHFEHIENINTINQLLIFTLNKAETFIKNIKGEEIFKDFLKESFINFDTTKTNFMHHTMDIFKNLFEIFKTNNVSVLESKLKLLKTKITTIYPKYKQQEQAQPLNTEKDTTQENFIFYLLDFLQTSLGTYDIDEQNVNYAIDGENVD